ncbi:hypothetical protein [Paenibacillus sp. FSL R7-0273]|uniref:hypothetical protein n=1 Tax=Paenibacillus sp. FSL R7-0273 TaxID=1536772 RepID=UPI000694C6EF|nr:hypothetical protein [Paenibacillus sp. FSL R7-0273]OMF95150.1 hypothetical protein BK144_06330 [Paenibacillus sp. FSL R7-0273]
MQIGMRIYYDKATGNVIHNTGEYVGRSYTEPTEDQDFAAIKELAQRVRETVGVLKLQYGQHSREFAQAESYRVDPGSGTLEFTYPGPQPNPLEGRLEAVETGSADTAQQLADALARLNETEAQLLDTQAALAESYEELQEAKREAVEAQVGLAELYELVLAGQQPVTPEDPAAPAEGGEEDNG